VIDGWTATYHKAAYDDCPDGTYTKVSGNAAAPATLTLS